MVFRRKSNNKKIEEELGITATDAKIQELKMKLQKVTEKTDKPNPYYAIIMLDGDNMGKWLSGDLLPDIENSYNSQFWGKIPNDFKNNLKTTISKKILTPEIHASISLALRNYALEFVRKIVEEEHLGVVVYAGGDDILAFANLKDLLPIVRKLSSI